MTSNNGWGTARGGFGILAIVGIFVLLVVAAYGGYWWLAKDTTGKRYDVNTGTQQYQQGLISENQDRVQDYHLATDPGQKEYLRKAFCVDVQRISPLPPDLASAKSDLCT